MRSVFPYEEVAEWISDWQMDFQDWLRPIPELTVASSWEKDETHGRPVCYGCRPTDTLHLLSHLSLIYGRMLEKMNTGPNHLLYAVMLPRVGSYLQQIKDGWQKALRTA